MGESKPKLNLRFAVGRPDGPRSSIWRAWSSGDDIYLAVKGPISGVFKYSIHRSGVCRFGFTREHGAPHPLADRAMIKWRRMATPPQGGGQGAAVVTIKFPTDFLSTTTELPKKAVRWIRAAPAGHATIIDFFFTKETRERVTALLGEDRLVSYTRLPNGEGFAIASSEHPWEDRDLAVPATKSGGTALLFPARDTKGTGRPVRTVLHFPENPKDGDRLFMVELGGHPDPVGSKWVPAPKSVAGAKVGNTAPA